MILGRGLPTSELPAGDAGHQLLQLELEPELNWGSTARNKGAECQQGAHTRTKERSYLCHRTWGVLFSFSLLVSATCLPLVHFAAFDFLGCCCRPLAL
ncbi:hypothetical protein NDU88_011011 [Pleurodeles waltl]|uniref:Uncharacterized protein n=1 Tax=Pleurodeles waltl TaxID=8319 RepID=A0AAV7Q1V9_PLEWA|nr:hypothetical protein NDU88_011011 [Pleurodeles waltl]